MLNPLDERALRAHRSRVVGIGFLRELLSHLNHIFGEINAALIAIAIGLGVLDFLCLLYWEFSTALRR